MSTTCFKIQEEEGRAGRKILGNNVAMCQATKSLRYHDLTESVPFRIAGLEKLVVGAEYIKLMWVPDTFFVNEKTAYFHEATTENQFLRILHTGEILRSIR